MEPWVYLRIAPSGKPRGGAMSISNALAGVAVKDLASSLPWYERLLDRSASRPMAEVGEFRFDRGGWLQVFQDEDRAGASSVTLTVTGLDRELEELKKKGISAQHGTSSKAVKTAIIKDPDGNQIVLAEPLTDRLAQ
jgi:predicted enzyme related to lactoylglutathione lyase